MESLLPSSPPSEPDPEDEIKRLIGEVAKRHKILVAHDDPSFLFLTLLELVSSRHLEKSDGILAMRGEALLDALERAAGAAKTTGEQLITAAADYVAKQTRSSVAELTEALTRAAAAERAKIDLTAKDARRVLWVSSCAAVAVLSILIGVAIGTWLAPDMTERVFRCLSFTIESAPPPSCGDCQSLAAVLN